MAGAIIFIESLLLCKLPCFFIVRLYMFVYIFARAYFIIAFWAVVYGSKSVTELNSKYNKL
jgi:hypothetical protein